MNASLSEIVCVIDRSGSMKKIREDAIGGYNTFLEDQQRLPGEARWTLVLFDDEYLLVEDGVPIAGARPLDASSYVPRGSTALLDAVGRTIDAVGRRLHDTAEPERPARVVVAILTDGFENASTDYDSEAVAERVRHQREKYGWEFLFLAADQDAVLAASRLAIGAENAFRFAATKEGTREAYADLSLRVAERRSL